MTQLFITNKSIDSFEKSCLEKLLSEDPLDTIRKNPDKQDWESISYSLALPEDFIREFKNYVDWYWICRNQKLSKEFIVEFFDKIRFEHLLVNRFVSQEVKDYCRMFL